MPEYTEPRTSARAQRSHARASLIRAAEGKSLWEVMEGYALESAVELRLGIDSPDPKERLTSARELLSAYTRIPPRPTLPPEAGITPGSDEWRQRCKDAEQDAAVRAFLVEEGWTPPKQENAN
jgi:hypothetical protein